MAKISTLQETWATQNTAVWTGFIASQRYVSGGNLYAQFLANYSNLQTVAEYDLISSTLTVPLVARPTQYGEQLTVELLDPNGRGIGFAFDHYGFGCYTGDNSTDVYTANDVAGWSWVRLREVSGTVFFDVSTDGAAWTNIRSTSTGLSTLLNRVKLTITAGYYNGGDSANFARIGPLNAGSGKTGTADRTATATLAPTVTARASSAPASRAALGTLTPTITGVTASAPQARTASVTLAATSAKTQLSQLARSASVTLTATQVTAVKLFASASASVTLAVSAQATIVNTAVLALETVWLNLASDLSQARAFVTMSGLQVTTEVTGEVRRYTTGRRRAVLQPGVKVSASLTLPALTREELAWLEAAVGRTVCFRDDRGRKLYGLFMSVPVTEHRYNSEGDTTLALEAVTYSEIR